MRSYLASPRLWVVVLLSFHLCANIWWLWADNHAVRTDEETHMIMARDYYNALFPRVGDRSFGARVDALVRIRTEVGNPVHPPLLHIAGAVLVRLIGYSVDRLAFVNTLAFLAAIVGVYLLTRLFLEPSESFFAALVFSLTPLVYVSSRYFMTDFLSMAFVVWILYALLRSAGFTCTRWSMAFGALSGLALLARASAPVYIFGPGLVALAYGIFQVFRCGDRWTFQWGRAIRLFFNGMLIAAMAIIVCGPWYLVHRDQFYQYWMKPGQDGHGAPLAVVQYTADESQSMPDTVEVKDAAKTSAPGAQVNRPKPEPERKRWRFLLRQRIPWRRYPVFVINNAVFLPMFCMFLVGMVISPLSKRFRKRFAPWILLSWVLGAYAVLTLALNWGTPRYALQALPALSVLSVLPLFLIPRVRLRRIVQGVYLAVLLFQYGNLTIHNYGSLAEAKIPVYVDKKFQQVYDDPGLYFFKSVLHGSFSYGRMQAPMKENYKDRLFFAMLETEQQRNYHGIEANYARLNIRGMALDEQHFWPDAVRPNPFARNDIPPELTPYRLLKHYGWGVEIDAILPALSMVDYVAYTTERIDAEKEQEWLDILEKNAFELIERFEEPRYGMVPARYFGLLARKNPEPLPVVETAEDIQQMGFHELYKVRHSAGFSRLGVDLQNGLVERLRTQPYLLGPPTPLNAQVDFFGGWVAHDHEDVFVFSLLLFNRAPKVENYLVLIEGRVTPETMASHFGELSGKYVDLQVLSSPLTPSSPLWPENDFVLVRFITEMHPIPCQIRCTLFIPGEGAQSAPAELGLVDFGMLRRPLNK